MVCTTPASPADGGDGAFELPVETRVSREGLPLPELRADALDLPGSAGPQDLYLEVFHDDRPAGRIAHVRSHDGVLWSRAGTLREIGLVVPAHAGEDWIALNTLPGLTYRYEADTQRLILNVPPSLRPLQRLGYAPPPAVQVRRDTGWLLGYDAYGRVLDGHQSLSVFSALRWFGRAGALDHTGLSRAGDDAIAYRRLETRWSYSDPERMWTWVAGDLISGGTAWTRPVRMGGVQWRREFGVRPDLITLPMPRFAADATVPSTVELYVNNIRQFGDQVQDGPFVLNALPRISGAGEATLVVTDVLGRTTETSVPLYVDHRRLAPGLTDFSVEAGVLRRGFASEDDDYGSDLVTSASLRHGLTPSLTLEGHGERGPGLWLAGAGMVWSPGNRWGAVSASYARSGGDTRGGQYTAGYQWNTRRYGFDLYRLRRSRGYRDLGDLGNFEELERDHRIPFRLPRIREQDRVTAWLPVARGSLTFGWLRWRDDSEESHHTRSLSWSQNFGRVSLSATVFDDDFAGRGGGLSLSMMLGERRYATAGVRRTEREHTVSGTLRQSAPYQGGWGWRLHGSDRPGGYAQAAAEVRGRIGEAQFGVDRADGRSGAFAQASGSLVLMDGRLFASRRIHDAFAVVSTNGRAGMPILSENRHFGQTAADGYLLVPDLRGWQPNRIAMDPDDLPTHYRVGEVEHVVTPADRAGVRVTFDVTRVYPLLLTLFGPGGEPVPAGSRGRLVASGIRVVAGFDGEVYIEDASRESLLELEINGTLCRYPVPAVAAETSGMQRHGPLRCGRDDP